MKKIRRISVALLAFFLLIQPFFAMRVMAQTFLPPVNGPVGQPGVFTDFNYPVLQPTIPNYGTPDGSLRGNWNTASFMNAVLTWLLQGDQNVVLNSSFTVNTINGNSAKPSEFGPLQNGFYLNELRFQGELKPGLSIYGIGRNQDDFNRAADIHVEDGYFNYSLKYEELIDRQIAAEFRTNSLSTDANPLIGYPDAPIVSPFPPPNLYMGQPLPPPIFGTPVPPNFLPPNVPPFMVGTPPASFYAGLGPLPIPATECKPFPFGSGQGCTLAFPIPIWQLGNFNPNQGFYPIIDNFVVNSLHWTSKDGIGILVSNRMKDQTGNQMWYLGNRFGEFQGELGRNNDYSDTTIGADYTSANNIQAYAAGTFRNWNNKQVSFNATDTINVAQISFGPGFTGNVPFEPFVAAKADDTFWGIDQTGLRVPVASGLTFTGTWKRWEKSTAGRFHNDTQIPIGAALDPVLLQSPSILDPNSAEYHTHLQPQYITTDYHGELSYKIDKKSSAFLNFEHWEDTPDASVLHMTSENRNNVQGELHTMLGDHSLSVAGGWEQNTINRHIDFRGVYLMDAFNPIANTAFAQGSLGNAVYNGYNYTFTPAAGGPVPGFVQTVAPGPPLFGPPACNSGVFPPFFLVLMGCGTNRLSYPVSGVVNVPTYAQNPNFWNDIFAPWVPFYGPGVGALAAAQYAGSYPVVAPLGMDTFKTSTYRFELRASGPITNNLDYRFTFERIAANNARFRTDPMDDWKYYAEINWNPSDKVSLNASWNLEDNKTNSKWLYPYWENHNTVSFLANWYPTSDFSMFAGFMNSIDKYQSSTPVLNSASQNFIGPPLCNPTFIVSQFSCSGIIGAPFDTLFNGMAAAYLANPLNNNMDILRLEDQEIYAGVTYNIDKDWNVGVNFSHSRPRTFQNPFLSNPVVLPAPFAPPGTTWSPNNPVDFYQELEQFQLMQSANDHRHAFSLSASRTLPDKSRIGFFAEYAMFEHLNPVIAGISVACGPLTIDPTNGLPGGVGAAPCANGTPFGFNSHFYGAHIDSGHVLSTSITYTKNF